jgi:hypothetical protein
MKKQKFRRTAKKCKIKWKKIKRFFKEIDWSESIFEEIEKQKKERKKQKK